MLRTEQKRKAKTRPSGRWRNRYWLPSQIIIRDAGPMGPGECFSRYSWPSREVAEQKALDCLDGPRAYLRRKGVRYLGASSSPTAHDRKRLHTGPVPFLHMRCWQPAPVTSRRL